MIYFLNHLTWLLAIAKTSIPRKNEWFCTENIMHTFIYFTFHHLKGSKMSGLGNICHVSKRVGLAWNTFCQKLFTYMKWLVCQVWLGNLYSFDYNLNYLNTMNGDFMRKKKKKCRLLSNHLAVFLIMLIWPVRNQT